MSELARPFLRAWDWVEKTAGFPGQVFAVIAVIMVIIGVMTWVGNRK
jgi:hypothetical protein